MIVKFSGQKLEERIIVGFIVTLSFTLILNVWNVTHLVDEYEVGTCNDFYDLFTHRERIGCSFFSPEIPLIGNTMILCIFISVLVYDLNAKRHFIVFKNIDKESQQNYQKGMQND